MKTTKTAQVLIKDLLYSAFQAFTAYSVWKDLLHSAFQAFTAYSVWVGLTTVMNAIWFFTFLRLAISIYYCVALVIIAVTDSLQDDKTFRELREAVALSEKYKFWFDLTSLTLYAAIAVCGIKGAFLLGGLLVLNIFINQVAWGFIKAMLKDNPELGI